MMRHVDCSGCSALYSLVFGFFRRCASSATTKPKVWVLSASMWRVAVSYEMMSSLRFGSPWLQKLLKL